jgi:SNF2 family DNA or RNA helicase
LRPIQRKIYDLIAAKTLKEIAEADIRDQARMQKFRTAKMVRLLQAASNPSMLDEKSTKFLVDSEQFGIRKEELDVREKEKNISEIFDTSFYDKVKNYSKYEIPYKLVEAQKIAQNLMEQKEKVIIWCSFKLNMRVFEEEFFKGQKPILINGDISDDPDDPDGRDERIKEFKEDANPRVLIATAASLGESVSLHQHLGKKVCSNAIYLDRNFNGAQFMQSMDRIHRIGMLPETVVNYHLIVAKNTIDEKIHQRLWEKNQDMHSALNSNDLEPLDYDGNVIEPNEKQSDKDYNALVEHLKGNNDPELKNYNVS